MTTATWVDAGPFRTHLQHLMTTGDLTGREVAALAGISSRATDSLLAGRHGRPVRRISHATALALLEVRPEHAEALRSCHVPAHHSRRRLLQLLASGAALEDTARQLGTHTVELQELADGTMLWCRALLALRLLSIVRSRPRIAAGPATQVGAPTQRAA